MNFKNMVDQILNGGQSPIIELIGAWIVKLASGATALVGYLAFVAIGLGVAVDMLFIHFKPLFYKIRIAKELRAAGGDKEGIRGMAGSLKDSLLKTCSTEGFGGFFIWVLSLMPDLMWLSSYSKKTGEIDDEKASNATMITWLVGNLGVIFFKAVIYGIIGSGFLFRLFYTGQNTITTVSTKVVPMMDIGGIFDKVIGDTGNIVIEVNDKTYSKLQNAAIDQVFAVSQNKQYKYSSDNKTNIRRYLEGIIKEQIDSNFSDLAFYNLEYDPNIVSYGVTEAKGLVNDPENLVSKQNQTYDNSNSDTNRTKSFRIEIPQTDSDGNMLCDDAKYKTYYIRYTVTMSTTKSVAYFNANQQNVSQNNNTTKSSNQNTSIEIETDEIEKTDKDETADVKVIIVVPSYLESIEDDIKSEIENKITNTTMKKQQIAYYNKNLKDGIKGQHAGTEKGDSKLTIKDEKAGINFTINIEYKSGKYSIK